MKRIWIVFLSSVVLLLIFFTVKADARVRPSSFESHNAVHSLLDPLADTLEGRVAVGNCLAYRRYSTVCFARVRGARQQIRFRVLLTDVGDVTGDGIDDYAATTDVVDFPR